MGFHFLYNNNIFYWRMNWECKLKELSEYDIAFEIKQGYYHIAMCFDDNWDILIPENKDIYLEKRKGMYHYIALVDNVSMDDIFTTIDNTIQYNKDLELKLELFKEKTKLLQDIFSKESYDKLKTIEFVFPKQKKTTRKTKQKENVVTEIPVSDANNVSVTDKINDTITSISTNDYDSNEEVVVTMNNDFVEELERE